MDDYVDHILSSDKRIEPSRNFAGEVMEAVHEEASDPQPIGFPWRRLVTGVAAFVIAVACLVGLAILPSISDGGRTFAESVVQILDRTQLLSGLMWIALGLALTYITVRLAIQTGR